VRDSRRRPVGRVPWAILGIFCVAVAAFLWGIYEASGSALLQWLAMMAAAVLWDAVAAHAAESRPLPPAPEIPSPTKYWLLGLILAGDLALLLGLAWGSEALLGFEPGFWFWFFLCYLVPLIALANKFRHPATRNTSARVARRAASQ
jgi:hypothetical protein